jgi:lipoate-protein ligase B
MSGDHRRIDSSTTGPLHVFDLGVAPYEPVQELQEHLRLAVVQGALPGVILLLEHEPVITLGKRGAPSDVRDVSLAQQRQVRVIRSERGGRATLHAPGQLVTYPILRIPHHDLRAYVHGLEETLVLLLAENAVKAQRRPGHPGLYLGHEKIASVGLRCHRWVASHGTALNVNIDLSLFELLTSCGQPDLRQTSLKEALGHPLSMEQVKASYVDAFCRVFGVQLSRIRALHPGQVEEALGLATPGSTGDAVLAEMPTAGFEPAAPGSGGQCSIP